MPTRIVQELIEKVVKLQADMAWVKRWIYVGTTAAITTAIGVFIQLIKN